jgi:hypothetical protein
MSAVVSFNLAVGEKFAALILNRARLRGAIQPMHLGKDDWLLPSPPIALQEHWLRWVGEVRSRAIEESNFWLVSKIPSSAPSERNAETKAIWERVHALAGALVLTGPLWFQDGFVVAGANVGGTVEVHQFADMSPRYRVSNGERNVWMIPTRVPLLARIVAGLDEVLPREDLKRVTRGINTFLRGLQRGYADARLHQFVRSLEGVIKPEIGASRRQFVHRGQTFTGARPDLETILGECFDIRSQVEHLHDPEEVLAYLPEDQGRERLLLHVRRMETLCRNVYTQLCVSSTHRDLFRDDIIDGFWKRPDHERTTLWGQPLDIAQIA